MRFLVLAISLALASGATAEEVKPTAQFTLSVAKDAKFVTVLGRTWAVAPSQKQPGVWIAHRDNNFLNMFGRPAARRTPQAIRAIETATGCKVTRSAVIQDISARFYAPVVCPAG